MKSPQLAVGLGLGMLSLLGAVTLASAQAAENVPYSLNGHAVWTWSQGNGGASEVVAHEAEVLIAMDAEGAIDSFLIDTHQEHGAQGVRCVDGRGQARFASALAAGVPVSGRTLRLDACNISSIELPIVVPAQRPDGQTYNESIRGHVVVEAQARSCQDPAGLACDEWTGRGILIVQADVDQPDERLLVWNQPDVQSFGYGQGVGYFTWNMHANAAGSGAGTDIEPIDTEQCLDESWARYCLRDQIPDENIQRMQKFYTFDYAYIQVGDGGRLRTSYVATDFASQGVERVECADHVAVAVVDQVAVAGACGLTLPDPLTSSCATRDLDQDLAASFDAGDGAQGASIGLEGDALVHGRNNHIVLEGGQWSRDRICD